MSYKKKVLLLILDGIGVAPKSTGNAVVEAQPKNLLRLWEVFPGTYLEASGEAVGLVENVNGNSEVGHLTIGCGKIHHQNLLKINRSIKKGHFFLNQTLKALLNHSLKNNSKIHLMGCLSDGSVHSHINHFLAVLEFLSKENFKGEVLIHAFTDGRDTPQHAAAKYFEILEKAFQQYKMGRIASICGRAYAMDRNNILHRTQRTYDLLIKGIGKERKNWKETLSMAYEKGQTDEYIEPVCLFQNEKEESVIKENDAVLFLNFRPDRAIQLSKAIVNNGFQNLFFASMAEYQKGFPINVLFPKEYLALPLGRIISEMGYKQIRIAESEKFPHVTYFFNGGQPIQYHGEDRIIVPSPNVATYDLKPEMNAYGVLNSLKQALNNNVKNYRFMVVNIANGDMVGHTGNREAGIKAMMTVDDVVSKAVKSALVSGWTVIITSDHGNLERMIDPTTQLPNPEHSQNPVPFLIVDNEIRTKLPKQLSLGSLSDIAPTILKLMGIERPSTMTGKSLI